MFTDWLRNEQSHPARGNNKANPNGNFSAGADFRSMFTNDRFQAGAVSCVFVVPHLKQESLIAHRQIVL